MGDGDAQGKKGMMFYGSLHSLVCVVTTILVTLSGRKQSESSSSRCADWQSAGRFAGNRRDKVRFVRLMPVVLRLLTPEREERGGGGREDGVECQFRIVCLVIGS